MSLVDNAPPLRRVFLSYSSKDGVAAEEIRESLSGRGAEVWSSQDLRPGDNIAASIQQEINEADDVLILVSKSSEDSPWMDYEAAAAIAARQSGRPKRIIPVLLDSRASPPPILSRFNYLDLSHKDQWGTELDRLTSTLDTGGPKFTLAEEAFLERQQIAAEELALERARLDLELHSVRLELSLRVALTLVTVLSTVTLIVLGIVGVFGELSGPALTLLGGVAGALLTRLSLDVPFKRWWDQRW